MPTRWPAIKGESIPTGRFFIKNVSWLTFIKLSPDLDDGNVSVVVRFWEISGRLFTSAVLRERQPNASNYNCSVGHSDIIPARNDRLHSMRATRRVNRCSKTLPNIIRIRLLTYTDAYYEGNSAAFFLPPTGCLSCLTTPRSSLADKASPPFFQTSLMPPRKPNFTGEFVSTGTYLIRNVRWLCYLELDTDNASKELNENVSGKLVSAVEENKKSQWWYVMDLGNGKHSFRNRGYGNFANCGFRAQKGTNVVGSSHTQQFKITECRVKGTYTIGPTDVQLYWGLSDDQLDTPVQQFQTRREISGSSYR